MAIDRSEEHNPHCCTSLRHCPTFSQKVGFTGSTGLARGVISRQVPLQSLVPMGRLELTRLSPPPPQDGVSTNFTTSADRRPGSDVHPASACPSNQIPGRYSLFWNILRFRAPRFRAWLRHTRSSGGCRRGNGLLHL